MPIEKKEVSYVEWRRSFPEELEWWNNSEWENFVLDDVCKTTKIAMNSIVKNSDGRESKAKGWQNLRAIKTLNRALLSFAKKEKSTTYNEVQDTYSQPHYITDLKDSFIALLKWKPVNADFSKTINELKNNRLFIDALKEELDKYVYNGKTNSENYVASEHLSEILSTDCIFEEIEKMIMISDTKAE